METFIYLIIVGLIYALLYSIYFVLFRYNTNFQANRIYLLFIVPLAFILPFINSNVEVATPYQVTLPVLEIGSIVTQTTSFNWANLFTYVYIGGSCVLLIVFFVNLSKTITTILNLKQGEDKNIQSFSFFTFIHVPKDIDVTDRKAIIQHEKVHSAQAHSVDVIIYEISKILLWWNPLIWMGLHSVKSNHEFIADKLASVKADKYSSVLVAQLLGVNCSALTNNFKSKTLIKKRIMMMKTKKSNRLSVLKYALVIPVIVITVAATANKNEPLNITKSTTSIGDDKVYEQVDVMPEFKGGIDALMKYLGSNVKYPAEAKTNKVEGTVYVSFVINKKGKVKETAILKAVNPLLDAEAKRVIEGMPKWKPGKKDGKKVNVKYVIPINFKLKE